MPVNHAQRLQRQLIKMIEDAANTTDQRLEAAQQLADLLERKGKQVRQPQAKKTASTNLLG